VTEITLANILARIQFEGTSVTFAVPNELELKLLKHRVALISGSTPLKNVVCTVFSHLEDIKSDYVVILFAEQFSGMTLASNVLFIYGELQ